MDKATYERVVKERDELRERFESLGNLVGTVAYKVLPSTEKSLLDRQSVHMLRYLDTLNRRIALVHPFAMTMREPDHGLRCTRCGHKVATGPHPFSRGRRCDKPYPYTVSGEYCNYVLFDDRQQETDGAAQMNKAMYGNSEEPAEKSPDDHLADYANGVLIGLERKRQEITKQLAEHSKLRTELASTEEAIRALREQQGKGRAVWDTSPRWYEDEFPRGGGGIAAQVDTGQKSI